jgi:hypothetical protein
VTGIVPIKDLYEKIRQWWQPNEKRMLETINNPIVAKWLGSFDTTLLEKSTLIRGVIGQGRDSTLVEIQTEGTYPSKAAGLELDSFYRHLISNVENQITQLEPGAPNIILVRGYNWLLSLFDTDELDPLHAVLKKFYGKKKNDHLSGVAFYEDDLDKAVYVKNDYAEEPSKLAEEDINKLGFTWLQF